MAQVNDGTASNSTSAGLPLTLEDLKRARAAIDSLMQSKSPPRVDLFGSHIAAFDEIYLLGPYDGYMAISFQAIFPHSRGRQVVVCHRQRVEEVARLLRDRGIDVRIFEPGAMNRGGIRRVTIELTSGAQIILAPMYPTLPAQFVLPDSSGRIGQVIDVPVDQLIAILERCVRSA